MNRVTVHKNLQRGDWSISQKGLVISNQSDCWLSDVTFYVCESMRQRVIERKRRKVHAWARGQISDAPVNAGEGFPISYNPYVSDKFTLRGSTVPIESARYVHFTADRGAIAYF
jgi:hypothetical protein